MDWAFPGLSLFDILRYLSIFFDISDKFWAQFGHSYYPICREIINFATYCSIAL